MNQDKLKTNRQYSNQTVEKWRNWTFHPTDTKHLIEQALQGEMDTLLAMIDMSVTVASIADMAPVRRF